MTSCCSEKNRPDPASLEDTLGEDAPPKKLTVEVEAQVLKPLDDQKNKEMDVEEEEPKSKGEDDSTYGSTEEDASSAKSKDAETENADEAETENADEVKQDDSKPDAEKKPKKRVDLGKVRKTIAKSLRDPYHDDGSLGPLMLRFAWHCCGTYDKTKKNGGSNGGTMRFKAEQADKENSGFKKARKFVAKMQKAFPGILSWADMAILCGSVSIEAMGGPRMPFCSGRKDFTEKEGQKVFGNKTGCPFGDGKHNPSGSRLPAADLGPDTECPMKAARSKREKPTIDAIRGTFTRLGFSDKETVCLIVLGHQFGRCHLDVSGYQFPWYTFDPSHWNVYLNGLGYLTTYQMAERGRHIETTNPTGTRQFNLNFGMREPFMMLPSDMALAWDPTYKKHIRWYDRHRRAFREDAIKGWTKLTELGCDNLLAEL